MRGLLSSQPMYKPRKDPYRNLHKGINKMFLLCLGFWGALSCSFFLLCVDRIFLTWFVRLKVVQEFQVFPSIPFRCQELLQQYQTSDQVRDTLISLGFDCTLTFGLAFSSMQMLDQHIQKFLPPGEDDTTSPACARIRGLCTKCNTIHTSTPIPAAQTFPPTPLPTTSVMNSSSNWHE